MDFSISTTNLNVSTRIWVTCRYIFQMRFLLFALLLCLDVHLLQMQIYCKGHYSEDFIQHKAIIVLVFQYSPYLNMFQLKWYILMGSTEYVTY
jgi:hypothetical protein